jgi:hypothetical protein
LDLLAFSLGGKIRFYISRLYAHLTVSGLDPTMFAITFHVKFCNLD